MNGWYECNVDPGGLDETPTNAYNAWWVKRSIGAGRVLVLRYGLGAAVDDLAAFDAAIASADTMFTGGDFMGAIMAYRAAGQTAVTTLGPELDAQTNGASVAATQQAWVANGDLAAITQATSANAAQAQTIARDMQALYAQAAGALQTAVTTPTAPLIQAAADLNGYLAANGCSQNDIPQVRDFQVAYNAAGGSLKIDGKYGPMTRAGLQHVMNTSGSGTAPAHCFTGMSAHTTVHPAATATASTSALTHRNYVSAILIGATVAGAGLIGYAYYHKHKKGHSR